MIGIAAPAKERSSGWLGEAGMGLRSTWRLLGEVGGFLRHNKRWWLAPIIGFIVLCSLLILSVQTSSITPIIYALF